MEKSKGVVLVAVGSMGYAYMAYNMAYSIKHHDPKILVHLIADDSFGHIPEQKRNVFDQWSSPEADDFHTDGNLDPGKLKSRIYKYLPFDHNLYLDVDGLCMQSLSPMMDRLIKDGRFYITSEQGRGKLTEKINYSEWSSNESISNHFKLDNDQDLVAIQSSWSFISKSKEAKSFFSEVANEFIKYDMNQLNYNWGGTMPDELIFSGVISKRNMRVDGPKEMIFFGSVNSPENASNIEGHYYILSIYGNGKGKTMTPSRYYEYYDALMNNWTRKHRNANDDLSSVHIYKSNIIKQYKHANKSKRT